MHFKYCVLVKEIEEKSGGKLNMLGDNPGETSITHSRGWQTHV